MYLSAEDSVSWPEATVFLGLLAVFTVLVGGAAASWLEFRKQKLAIQQQEDVRQLVRRYEKLAESTMDHQQRATADLADLRTRTTAIETLLRTVE